jgi:ERF superfamily
MSSTPSPNDVLGPDGQETRPSAEGSALVLRQPGVEGLIALAIEHGSAVDALERLLGMRERLKAEAAREAFFEALSAFQADCPVIEKGKTAKIESRTGGSSFSYKYAPLEDIMRAITPSLRRYGLSVRFEATFEATPPAQVVKCIVNHRDGHSESSEFRSPIDTGARMSVMQQSASSLTYGRRYALLNALGIVVGGEDDDGVGSSRPSRTGGNPAGGMRADNPASGAVSAPSVVEGTVGGTAPGPASEARARWVTSPNMAGSPPSPRPLGRNVVRIARPPQEPQGSDGPPTVLTSRDSVAETPAAPETDNDVAKAELRRSLIEDWMKLLRATGKFNDLNDEAMWTKAADVLSAQCEMQFMRPLHEMNLRALQDARRKTDETMAQKLGATA